MMTKINPFLKRVFRAVLIVGWWAGTVMFFVLIAVSADTGCRSPQTTQTASTNIESHEFITWPEEAKAVEEVLDEYKPGTKPMFEASESETNEVVSEWMVRDMLFPFKSLLPPVSGTSTNVPRFVPTPTNTSNFFGPYRKEPDTSPPLLLWVKWWRINPDHYLAQGKWTWVCCEAYEMPDGTQYMVKKTFKDVLEDLTNGPAFGKPLNGPSVLMNK